MGLNNLYLAIKAQVQAEVPEVAFVAVWNNQLGDIESQQIYSFPFPALFIEYQAPAAVKQLGNGYQIFDPLIVRVHIIHEQLDAQDGTQEQNLDVFIHREKVHKALQKFCPDGAVSFVRSNEFPDYDHTNLYHYVIEYTTNYVDVTTSEPIGAVTTTPPTALEITKDVLPDRA